jgi:hypothetical protein
LRGVDLGVGEGAVLVAIQPSVDRNAAIGAIRARRFGIDAHERARVVIVVGTGKQERQRNPQSHREHGSRITDPVANVSRIAW